MFDGVYNDMYRAQTLKDEATDSAVWRGHRLGPWDNNGPTRAYAECDCGASVTVDTNPPPNGIDIGGDAVAINHPRTPSWVQRANAETLPVKVYSA